MSTVRTPTEQRLVLYGVSWRDYARFLRACADRPGVRLNYDRGALEIMTLSYEHESWSHLLDRFVVVLTEELGFPLAGGGSTTFRRRRRQRGLETDNCYWIANEALVRGKHKIDLRLDPPPDLALEIDVSHSSLNRLAIHSALGIREVWRYSEHVVTFHVLDAEGKYQVQEHSLSFAELTPADLMRFLALRGEEDENGLVRKFREWVRDHLKS